MVENFNMHCLDNNASSKFSGNSASELLNMTEEMFPYY